MKIARKQELTVKIAPIGDTLTDFLPSFAAEMPASLRARSVRAQSEGRNGRGVDTSEG